MLQSGHVGLGPSDCPSRSRKKSPWRPPFLYWLACKILVIQCLGVCPRHPPAVHQAPIAATAAAVVAVAIAITSQAPSSAPSVSSDRFSVHYLVVSVFGVRAVVRRPFLVCSTLLSRVRHSSVSTFTRLVVPVFYFPFYYIITYHSFTPFVLQVGTFT